MTFTHLLPLHLSIGLLQGRDPQVHKPSTSLPPIKDLHFYSVISRVTPAFL